MPWSNGIFTLLPVSHADPGTTIRAEQQNGPHEDFAAGLNNCLTRDGSTSMLANLPMNGRKIVNLAQGTAASDAVRLDQLPASSEWLEAVAALTMTADRFPYATGPNAAAMATLTAFARTLLDDPDAETARATLGLTIATTALAVLNAAAGHNTASWQAGAATTPGFPSPAQLRAGGIAAAAVAALGVGQSWQDLTATRRTGTSYQNTTAKPIMVSITDNLGGNPDIQVSADGSTWVTIGLVGANSEHSFSFIVPPGHYYRVNTTVFQVSIWSELR